MYRKYVVKIKFGKTLKQHSGEICLACVIFFGNIFVLASYAGSGGLPWGPAEEQMEDGSKRRMFICVSWETLCELKWAPLGAQPI